MGPVSDRLRDQLSPLTLLAVFGIIGGQPSSDSAVVCLAADGAPLCSGSLIGQKTVLTAGHCAWPLGMSAAYVINVGPDCRAPVARARVSTMVTHPQYTAEGAPFDVALIELETPLDAGTLALHEGALDGFTGSTIRHVGYGTNQEDPMSGWGSQRAVTHAVLRVDADFIWSGDATANTCTGDSGGPALDADGLIAGIVSDGPDCHSPSADVRVDAVASWVKGKLLEWEPPPEQHVGCSASPGSAWLALALLLLRRR